jgi:predicted transposase/invertase (TIGR01784 family)
MGNSTTLRNKKRYDEEGIQKGKEKGIQEQKKKMAKMMKQNGEPAEKIIAYTGLTKQVIQRLK